jgi:hypothetical protein
MKATTQYAEGRLTEILSMKILDLGGTILLMKAIEIHRYVKACPECGWKPADVEQSAILTELIDHVKISHEMGEPRILIRNLPVASGFQECKVAIFGNQIYWRWIDGFPKTA